MTDRRGEISALPHTMAGDAGRKVVDRRLGFLHHLSSSGLAHVQDELCERLGANFGGASQQGFLFRCQTDFKALRFPMHGIGPLIRDGHTTAAVDRG